MTKIVAIALFLVLAGTLAVHAVPRDAATREAVAAEWPVQPSFDVALPVLSEASDVTSATKTATVGGARSE